MTPHTQKKFINQFPNSQLIYQYKKKGRSVKFKDLQNRRLCLSKPQKHFPPKTSKLFPIAQTESRRIITSSIIAYQQMQLFGRDEVPPKMLKKDPLQTVFSSLRLPSPASSRSLSLRDCDGRKINARDRKNVVTREFAQKGDKEKRAREKSRECEREGKSGKMGSAVFPGEVAAAVSSTRGAMTSSREEFARG